MKLFSNVIRIIMATLFFISSQIATADYVEKLKNCDDLLNKYDEKLSNYSFDDEDKDELSASIQELESLSEGQNIPPKFNLCLYALYVLAEDNEKALVSLNKYIRVSEPDQMLYFLSSMLNKEIGDMAEALHQIDSGIALNDTLPHFYHRRAEINYELGNYVNALDDISKEMQIIGEQNKDIGLHFLHAKILMSLKQYKRAIDVLTDNISLIDGIFTMSEKGGYFIPRVENYNLLLKAYCEVNEKDTAASVYEKTKIYQPKVSKPECI